MSGITLNKLRILYDLQEISDTTGWSKKASDGGMAYEARRGSVGSASNRPQEIF